MAGEHENDAEWEGAPVNENEAYLAQVSQFIQANRRTKGELRECLRIQWQAVEKADTFIPLVYLCTALGLDEFERFCIQMAVAGELHPPLYTVIQAMHEFGYELACPTALMPGSVLLRHCLRPWEDDIGSMLERPLKLEARILQFILYGTLEDAMLQATLWQPEDEAPQEQRESFVQRLLKHPEAERTVVFLEGVDTENAVDTAKAVCLVRDVPLLLLPLSRLVELGMGGVTRLEREFLLFGTIPCITAWDTWKEAEQGAWWTYELTRQLSKCLPLVFLQGECAWKPPLSRDYTFIPLCFPLPDESTRLEIWRTLGGAQIGAGVSLERLTEKYRFTRRQIKTALAEAVRLAAWQGMEKLDEDILSEACRRQCIGGAESRRMKEIPAVFTWEDLILPPRSKELLQMACERMGQGQRVYGTWGFQKKLPYGRGLSLLFAGPPGTGKTMGAQVVAACLKLPLYRVDLAAVVSKYIGETEKNLDEIFEQAKKAQGILLFDEADVLFGKRTEIRDSNDKYSNMEAAFLLQRVEEYEGITILATNYLQNFDEAFKRRIQFIVDFPFPNQEERRLLWSKAFPVETPLEEPIDTDFLAARFELSGSHIKNIALNAAFSAAAAERAVGMQDIIRALRVETAKLGKAISKESLGVYRALWER